MISWKHYALVALTLFSSACTTTDDEAGPDLVSLDQCSEKNSNEPTPGELGRAEFVYDYGSLACAFGCSADNAIAERSRVQIQAVGGAKLPAVTVTSDAPEVATFEIGKDGDIHVTAHSAGKVRFELRDTDDVLVEALALEVKPVKTIRLSGDAASISIMLGGSAHLLLDLADEQGCDLVGVGGIDYALEGGLSASQVKLSDALAEAALERVTGSAVSEFVDLDAQALGSGMLSGRAPGGGTFELPLAIVDESAIAKITVYASDDAPVGSSSQVRADATDAKGQAIFDPACTWSIEPTTGPVSFASEERDSAFVTSESAASASVSCRVGAAQGSGQVTFK